MDNIELKCNSCGKPLTECNEYGMFCEDLCEMEESIEAKSVIGDLIDSLMSDGLMGKGV